MSSIKYEALPSTNDKVKCLSSAVQNIVVEGFASRLVNAVMTEADDVDETTSYDPLVNSIIKDFEGTNTLESFDLFSEPANKAQFVIFKMRNYAMKEADGIGYYDIIAITSFENIIAAYNSPLTQKIPTSFIKFKVGTIDKWSYEIFAHKENSNVFTINIHIIDKEGNEVVNTYIINAKDCTFKASDALTKITPFVSYDVSDIPTESGDDDPEEPVDPEDVNPSNPDSEPVSDPDVTP